MKENIKGILCKKIIYNAKVIKNIYNKYFDKIYVLLFIM